MTDNDLLPSQKRALVSAYLFGFPGVVNAASRLIFQQRKYVMKLAVRDCLGNLIKHVPVLTKLGVDTAEDLLSDYVEKSREQYP